MCRKKRFRDPIAAKLALAGGAGDKGSIRYYWCRTCRAYHTTSQPKRAETLIP